MRGLGRLLFLALLSTSLSWAGPEADIASLATRFAREIRALKIPELAYDYRESFRSVQDLPGIRRQREFFERYRSALGEIDSATLGFEDRLLRVQLSYEIDENLGRLALEEDYKARYPDLELPADGLYRLPNHEAWYRMILRRYSAREITPDEVFALGEREVRRVSAEIRRIQGALGFAGDDAAFYRYLNRAEFFLDDPQAVRAAYEEIRERVARGLGAVVENTSIPVVEIRPVPTPNRDTPPGYYDAGVFYFNPFGGHYNRRGMEMLFIHEGNPGHHYQVVVPRVSLRAPEFQNSVWYPGFTEGWAAYAETLGQDLGLYRDPMSELGKWEWDLVRSARLVLDVGIHDRGWSREEALRYFKRTVPNQDAIAEREVDRVIRWPGQVVSYKVGEAEFLRLRERARQREGGGFDPRRFHARALSHGSIPFPVLNLVVD